MTCAIALQAALEREQDANRQLRESLAAMARESGEKSELIRHLERQLAEARKGDLEHD